MKSFKILFLFALFAATCNSVLSQTNTDKKPCFQGSSERSKLIKEADENPYRVKRIEFFGNVFIRDKVLRESLALNEGDIFTREFLIKSIKNINKSKKIYPISLKDVKIYLDKSNKDAGLVFCVKDR